jgi:predicted ABC-type ATPase
MPIAVLIAGSNGAGKTTLARRLLPLAYPDARFLNADEIQRMTRFSTPAAAGRELIQQLRVTVESSTSFAVETTLSSVSYARQFGAWRARGYEIVLHYLQVVSADFAVGRVARRVAEGGHDIPEQDIRRRYARGVELFETLYRPSVDLWYHYRVDERGPELVESNESPR